MCVLFEPCRVSDAAAGRQVDEAVVPLPHVPHLVSDDTHDGAVVTEASLGEVDLAVSVTVAAKRVGDAVTVPYSVGDTYPEPPHEARDASTVRLSMVSVFALPVSDPRRFRSVSMAAW